MHGKDRNGSNRKKKRVEPKVPTKKNGLDNNEYFVLVTYF